MERGVTLGGEDLPGVLEEVRLAVILKEFTSKAMDVWLNTSILMGNKQLGNLRPAISKLKVGHIVLVFYNSKSI